MALSKTINPLNLKPNYMVVAAIDFGTTYCGYAFSFKGKDQEKLIKIARWESAETASVKCPSAVLTGPHGEFCKFGYEAEQEYNNHEPSDGYQLYRHFKMSLYGKSISKDSEVESVTGYREKAITVFAMALQFLKCHMLDIINKAVAMSFGNLDEELIRWVITVPAIWENEAKSFMRLAAYQAGITEDVDSNALLIALEPEAASFYCRSGDDYSDKPWIKAGEVMHVIDAGGGTVDITIHEQQIDGNVKEISAPSGGPWGGTTVDRKFDALLGKVFGPDFINHMKSKQPQHWLSFLRQFESIKRKFKADGKMKLKLSIPFIFNKEYNKLHGKDIDSAITEANDKNVKFRDGYLEISQEAALNFFHFSCSEIVKHVRNLLDNPMLPANIHLFIVGGYGESSVLQETIKKDFGESCKISVPLDPQLAIVKGAVLFGHSPNQIASRIATGTYGCAANLVFDETKHDMRRRYQSERDGQYRCQGTLKVFVKKGDELKNPEVITHTVHPKSKNETQAIINILRSENRDVVYSDEEGVTKAGVVKLESSDGPLGEDIELRITFGHTEILIEARDTQRGPDFPVKTSLNFEINN